MSINPHPNWIIKNLEDSCDILDGQRIPLNEETRNTIKGTIPYYGANGVVDYINKYIFDEKLILIAEDGGYFNEYKTRPIAYMIKDKSWVNNHAHVLRVREKDGLSTEYIFYNLEHKNVMQFIKGSTRTKLNQAELRKIPIPVPPLVEQRGIAEVLGTVDDAIKRSDEVIAKIEGLKRGLMKRLLTRGIGHTEFKHTELGEIPKTWQLCQLDKVTSFQNGRFFPSDDYTNNGIKLLRLGNLDPDGFLKWNEGNTIFLPIKYAKETSEWIIKENEIIMNLTAQSLEDEFLGRVSLSDKNEYCLLNQRLARIKTTGIETGFLFWLLKSPIFRRFVDKLPGGTKIKHIYSREISKFILPLPPVNEQNHISRILFDIRYKKLYAKKQLLKLDLIKKGLTQALLSGQVRVRLDEGGLHRIRDS